MAPLEKSSALVTDADLDPAFPGRVNAQSGENVGLCYHCRTCAGGCPLVGGMDYPPHWIFRMVQMGMKSEALRSSTIWICVACNTCSVQCPNGIDIPAVMDTLRQMALAEGIKPAEPNVLTFHEAVLKSIKSHGRTHKLGIMMNYKLKTLDLFSDAGKGTQMFLKGKLEILPSKVKAVKKDIRPLFQKK